jgi:hypothetical protein
MITDFPHGAQLGSLRAYTSPASTTSIAVCMYVCVECVYVIPTAAKNSNLIFVYTRLIYPSVSKTPGPID